MEINQRLCKSAPIEGISNTFIYCGFSQKSYMYFAARQINVVLNKCVFIAVFTWSNYSKNAI